MDTPPVAMAPPCRRRTAALMLAALVVATLSAVTLLGGNRTALAADNEGFGGLIVYGDTVRGGVGLTPEEIPVLSCVLANRFPQGSAIVWRIRVIDPQTGEAMDGSALESVVLTLPDGSTKNLTYGPHPRGRTDDYFWATSFAIPADYPTGSFNFQVTATALDGRTGTLVPFNIASSMVQIVSQGSR